MPVKKRDIYVLLKQTGYSPRIPVGSNVQRGMWPCVTTCYKEDPLSLSLSLSGATAGDISASLANQLPRVDTEMLEAPVMPHTEFVA